VTAVGAVFVGVVGVVGVVVGELESEEPPHPAKPSDAIRIELANRDLRNVIRISFDNYFYLDLFN
jgi:hypothetical protein